MDKRGVVFFSSMIVLTGIVMILYAGQAFAKMPPGSSSTDTEAVFSCYLVNTIGSRQQVQCTQTQYCSDSDNGINYNVSGNVTYTNSTNGSRVITLVDYCSGSYLFEAYCVNRKRGGYATPYLCQYGCSNGACLQNPNNGTNQSNQTPAYCFDSDGGINFNTSGHVNWTNATGSGTYYDYCSANSIFEYYCNSNNNPQTTSSTCTYGCSNGACLQNPNNGTNQSNQTNSCQDTDGGYNGLVQGTVSGTQNGMQYSYTDYCNTASGPAYVFEYQCSGTSWLGSNLNCAAQYGQAYTCQAGACILNNQTGG